MQLRNTPDPDCDISPAQIIFGKPLRDSLAFVNRLEKFSNPNTRPSWREAWKMKELALCTRYARSKESLDAHARPAHPLHIGDKCFVQNGAGHYPKHWDRTGTVTEVLDHDKYCIKIDGSGRLTKRNWKNLRAFVPLSTNIIMPSPAPSYPLQRDLQTSMDANTSNPPLPCQASATNLPPPTQTPVELPPLIEQKPHSAIDVSAPLSSPGDINMRPSPTGHVAPTLSPTPPASRPRRLTKKPAWQESNDWILE